MCIRVLDKGYNIDRDDIRKGMIVLENKDMTKNVCYKFKARVKILHHSTSIRNKYSSVIHCETIRQTAQIILPEGVKLKTNSDEEVYFKFIKKPEFLRVGTTFVFREGTTRGKGVVLETYSIVLSKYL